MVCGVGEAARPGVPGGSLICRGSGRSDPEGCGGGHGAESLSGCSEVGVPWPVLGPEGPGLPVADPEDRRGSEEATSQLFGVGVFELGAGEEVELEPAAEGVGPADH